MNRLTKYGLIAEIIGALAVVVSLVFLAVEVRGHSVQLERQVAEERLASFSSVRRAFGATSYVGELLQRARETPDQLSYADRFALWNVISEALFVSSFYHRDVLAGRQSGGAWPMVQEWLSYILASDYAREWWRDNAGGFPETFIREIDQIVD